MRPTFRSNNQRGDLPTTPLALLLNGSLSPPNPPLHPPGPSFPLSSRACTFTDQPPEDSLGSRPSLLSWGRHDFQENPPMSNHNDAPNILSLTQHNSCRERQTQVSWFPGWAFLHFTVIILTTTTTTYWHLLYVRHYARTWHVLPYSILTKTSRGKY